MSCIFSVNIGEIISERRDRTIQPRSYHRYSNLIDASPKKPIDKEQLLKLLQSHGVKTDSIDNLKTAVEDVIPSLRKAKINIPETFFKDRKDYPIEGKYNSAIALTLDDAKRYIENGWQYVCEFDGHPCFRKAV